MGNDRRSEESPKNPLFYFTKKIFLLSTLGGSVIKKSENKIYLGPSHDVEPKQAKLRKTASLPKLKMALVENYEEKKMTVQIRSQ